MVTTSKMVAAKAETPKRRELPTALMNSPALTECSTDPDSDGGKYYQIIFYIFPPSLYTHSSTPSSRPNINLRLMIQDMIQSSLAQGSLIVLCVARFPVLFILTGATQTSEIYICFFSRAVTTPTCHLNNTVHK